MRAGPVLVALSIVALLMLVAVPIYYGQPSDKQPAATSELSKFHSYPQLKAFVEGERTKYLTDELQGTCFRVPRVVLVATTVTTLPARSQTVSASLVSGAQPAPSLAYSSTNVQATGVEEADIVKTDGQYLYVVSGHRIFILKASPPEEAALLSRIDVPTPVRGISMFVNRDRLILLLDHWAIPPDYAGNTTIQVWDITNRRAPSVIRDLTVTGGYITARQIQDYIYVVLQDAVAESTSETTTVRTPKITTAGHVVEVPASSVYYSNVTDYASVYAVLLALNTQDANEDPSVVTVLTGQTSTVHISPTNLYLTMTHYELVTIPVTDSPYVESCVEPQEQTLIHRFAIQGPNVQPVSSGSVPGGVLNQGLMRDGIPWSSSKSMDEYQGQFRIVTAQSWNGQNTLYVLGPDMQIEGKLEGLAPGERMWGVRFVHERAYVVTSQNVQSLFVVDVSAPTNPTQLGQLKFAGSLGDLRSYDETRLIGIGKEVVLTKESDFVWYKGVKISLFDVADVGRPHELSPLALGDYGTSVASEHGSPELSDPKALLVDREHGILVAPVALAAVGPTSTSALGDLVFQGAYVFEISPEGGLAVRGRITHWPLGTLRVQDGYYHLTYDIKRSLYIGDVLYTISDRQVLMSNLQTLELVGVVELPPSA